MKILGLSTKCVSRLTHPFFVARVLGLSTRKSSATAYRYTLPLCVISEKAASRRISLRDTPKSNPIEMSRANAMRARSVATQGSRDESDLSCQRNVTFYSEGAPMIEDATLPLESYCDSLRDPASAQVPRAFACSSLRTLDSQKFDSVRRTRLSPLRMTHGGGAVRTCEKNAVCDGYTSSGSFLSPPSPQGEACRCGTLDYRTLIFLLPKKAF